MNSVETIVEDGFVERTSAATPSTSKLRVLVISHAYVTGVNQGKLDVIAQTQPVEIGLLVPQTWRSPEWTRLLALETPYSSITVYPAKVLFSGRGGAHLYWPWTIWNTLRKFKPDVIHIEEEVFSLSTLEFAIFAKLFCKPLAVFGWENMDRKLSGFRQWVRRIVLDTASFIIPGNAEGEQLLRQWGYKGALEIMPQIGVDAKLFVPVSKEIKSSNVETFNVETTNFCIGYMGRIANQKGLDTLLIAAKKLCELGCEFQVTLCGSGPDEAALKTMVEEQGLTKIVHWTGGVPHADVPKEMGKFDVLVLPSKTVDSWKEQFGHVLIEAMCMGIPVVGSACGEIPNVIGRPDLVFAEGDAPGLATILKRILTDAGWYEELKQYSLERVEKHYKHERIAQRLTAIWGKLR